MWSANNNTIQVFFVLTENQTNIDDMSETMQLALQDCINHAFANTLITEKDVCSMKLFKKSQIFVYDRFEGPAFQHVLSATKQNKAKIVGPMCLRTCLIEAISIPENNSPVYTMAMRNIVLSVSNLSPIEKKKLKEKIQYMGGIFSHNLRNSTTHLMVGKVGSLKYTKAIETGITIMTENWVDAVWEESIICNIISTLKKFDKYKCPPLYKLEITTSGLEEIDRKKVITLINANGGNYSAQMKKDKTNVLILLKPIGQKFIYAQQWGLMCLKPSWIYDCVEKGFMLETQNYIVKNTMLNSTPNISHIKPIFSQDDISAIVADKKSTIEETFNNNSTLKCQQINDWRSQYHSKNIDYKAILNCINLSEVKKAGIILNGCKIYCSGFSLTEEERIKRIVISIGGIRYTELNESITHILVGDFSASLPKLINSIQNKPHIVNLNWLLESINLKCIAREEQFLAMDSSHSFTPEPQSFLSKTELTKETLSQPKNIDKPSTSILTDDRPLANCIEQYLNDENNYFNDTLSQKSSYATEDTMSTQDSRLESILEGLIILLYNLDSQQLPSIKKKIISMGGITVNTHNNCEKIDYAVVPIVFDEVSLSIKSNVVNCLWIIDCYNNVEQVPVEYYHKPVIFSGSTPLKNCVISVTNYVGSERYFLKEVSLLLGAHFQDTLSRKLKLEDNIMISTHLICLIPEGHKYEASVKWGVPVISKDWLLQCLAQKQQLQEDTFLINENATKSSLVDSTDVSSSRYISESFAQRLAMPALQENDIKSEIVIPLKDTYIESQPKKNYSVEMIMHTSQLLEEPANKLTPPFICLKSTYSTPVSSKSFMDNLKTPDTPYGQIFCDNPVTPQTKKNWKRWIDTLPDGPVEPSFQSPKNKRRNSTPLSELKRQLWEKILHQPTDKNKDSKQQSLNKQEFKRTLKELQHDLCNPRESDIHLIDSHSQDYHAKNSLFKERVIESSVQYSVGWEDPAEQQEKARLKKLTECNRKFMLTNINSDYDRQKYENAIEKLGAQVLQYTMFCEDVTHVLMHQPSRSEKYLCALASGKWILHPSYIDACLEKNCFLPEDKYEWGNPLSDLSLSTPLHGASYRWRSKIIYSHSAAFSGMKAVLMTSEDRHEALKRLIQAGGGIILDKKELLNSTHCIVDQDFNDIPVSLNEMAVKGILLLPALFLADFLIKDPSPDPKLYLVPEYQAFYNRLAFNNMM